MLGNALHRSFRHNSWHVWWKWMVQHDGKLSIPRDHGRSYVVDGKRKDWKCLLLGSANHGVIAFHDQGTPTPTPPSKLLGVSNVQYSLNSGITSLVDHIFHCIRIDHPELGNDQSGIQLKGPACQISNNLYCKIWRHTSHPLLRTRSRKVHGPIWHRLQILSRYSAMCDASTLTVSWWPRPDY